MFSTPFIGKIGFALLKMKLEWTWLSPASSTWELSFGKGRLAGKKKWFALEQVSFEGLDLFGQNRPTSGHALGKAILSLDWGS